MARCSQQRDEELLATPILRFQCLEQAEENRETQLHAHESGETWTGHPPEIVAVEQLPFLSVSREGFVHTRSRTEVTDRCEENRKKTTEEKAKTHPLQKPQRVRHPELQLLQPKTTANSSSGLRV